MYCSLQHWTLLLPADTSTTGHCFHFGAAFSFFLELCLCSSQVAYWALTDLRSSSFSVILFWLFAWTVRSMNQHKLKVVKQEMTRLNMDMLGISELKRTGMGEFNSDDRYIYYCEQEPLRRNGEALIVNKRVQNTVFGCNLKKTRWSVFISKANHSIPQ